MLLPIAFDWAENRYMYGLVYAKSDRNQSEIFLKIFFGKL